MCTACAAAAAAASAASAAAGTGAFALPHRADGGDDCQGDRKEDQDIPNIHAVFLTRFL